MDKEELKKLLGEIKAEEEEEEEPKKEEEEDTDKDKKVEVTKSVEELVEKLGDKIAEAFVAKGVSDTNAQNIKRQLFSVQGGLQAIKYPDNLSNLTDEQTIVLFFKSLVMKDRDEESYKVFKALNEGTAAEGGYLVPTPLATEIWRILPDVTVMRKIATVIPMTALTLKLNSLSARPSAYWTSEYATKTTSSAEFGQTTLTVNDLVCLLPVSQQLIADANINLVNYIIQLFVEAIGMAEDKAFFTGTDTTQPRGINQETLTTVSAGGAISFDHIIALIDSVPQRVGQSPNAAFVGHRYVKRLLRNLKDTTNNYIWRDARGGVGGGGENIKLPDTLYGYPYYEQNDISQDELYFGDWKYYIIGDRQQITVETTTEGGDAWRRNSMEIKAVERVDGRAIIVTPFAKINTI